MFEVSTNAAPHSDRFPIDGDLHQTVNASLLLRRSRRVLKKVLIAILLLMSMSEQSVADKATDDFNLGLGFYRGKRWEQAAETLSQFLKEFPEHPRANLARLYFARSLSVLEKYEPAREEFAKFIRAEPASKDIADARYRLGECSYFLKDYAATIPQMNLFLEKHKEHALANWASLLLGDSLVAVKDYQKAVDILTPLSRSQASASVLADARFSLGKAFEGLNRTQEAIEQYKVVVSDRNSTPAPRALNRLAAIQYAVAEYPEAAASFERLIAEYPRNSMASSATLGAGISWYRAGEFQKAIEWLNKVPQESSGRAQAIMIAAMSLKELGRIEESRQVFEDALKAAGDTPFAAEVLFQRAQMERTAGSKVLAAQMFEDISDRWPQFGRVADCRFNAAELRLELDQKEHAERLWNRLRSDFPERAARPREQVLLGRLYLARGDLEKSIETLQKATEASPAAKDRVSAVGQYYLVRAFYESKNYAEVIQQTSRMGDLLADDALSEVRSVLALATLSSLELQQHAEVLRFADAFLLKGNDEQQRADVTAARAVALSRLKRFGEAVKDLTTLIQSRPDNPQTWTAVLKSAEAALELNAPKDAAVFFTMASGYDKDPAIKEAGLSGIAWSQFKAAEFPQAEESFARIVTDYPASEDNAQSRFMVARCVEEQGDVERTAAAYAAVFAAIIKDQPPAAADSEAMPPLQYAFDAGRQAARFLEKAKRIDDADKVWERLAVQFPSARDLDRILDEWAWMNATAQRFEKSDSIHRQLLERFPNSPFAGQARLSLAESVLETGKLDDALREMEAIFADDRYGAAEKERALFHVIEINAAQRNWQPMLDSAGKFLANYAVSPLAPQVRLFSGNALIELRKLEEANRVLSILRNDIETGKIPPQDWTDRVWILLAEASLALMNYEQIDVLEGELRQRNGDSVFAFQMMDIQGRRWKQQAPPDFGKARDYFRLVTSDPAGQGTETAARCQFLFAETLVLEMKLDEAVKEYFKVYLNYSYDELRAQALFQAASCEAQLKKTEAALRDYKELIAMFPNSDLAEKAVAEIKKLGEKAE